MPNGIFHNPWPNSEPRGFGDVLRWQLQRRRQKLAKDPPRNSFPIASPAIVYPRASEETFTATWIGHSTVLLQMGGINVITDPMFSARAFPVQWAGPRRLMDPGLALDALPPIDIVLLSHNHYDHLDEHSVRRIARSNPDATWIGPLAIGPYVRRWGPRDVAELDWWKSIAVRGLKVTATPARHFSARTPRDRNRSLWCGFAFEIGSHRAFFAGDTAYHPEFGAVGARLGPFDFTMIPIGAYDPRWFMSAVHVNPEESVQIYEDVTSAHSSSRRPIMLAIHWGTFRLTDEPADEPPRRAVDRWNELHLDPDRLWIARFGETRSVLAR